MRTLIGSSVTRVFLAACMLVGTSAVASAQRPIADVPAGAAFLPRFDWSMSAAGLLDPDPRFDWDTHWTGDFDLFSVPKGRVTFLADYQTLLGSQYRPFDPYQSNYLLEASGSFFAGRTEIAGVLNHISRHLGDRPKRLAVAENSLGPRVMRRFQGNKASFDARAEVRKVIARAYLDYTWIEQIELVARRDITPRTSVYGRSFGQLIQVDPEIAGRGTQKGGRVEIGITARGRVANLDLFAGGEQMIDADVLDRLPRRWAFAGFRLVSK